MKTQEIESKLSSDPALEEMMLAGLHFGHRLSKTHPKMKPYISGIRNAVHLIDLQKTKEKLQESLVYIEQLVKDGKIILLVGTKIQLRSIVKEVGGSLGIPYVANRWIGGTLTNFSTITKRIEYLKDLEGKRERGELEKYTKKERANVDKTIKDLEEKFGGIKEMPRLPDAVFICDPDENMLVVREAKKMKIPVIAIVDTNIDPTPMTYFIPANDDAVSSVRYLLEKVKEAIEKAKIQ